MLVTCHECQAKYSIADDKVRGRSARVRCRHCSTIIEVSALAPVYAASPAPVYDDPTTVPRSASLRRAAVLPRDEDRARRDLFAPAQDHLPSFRPAAPPPSMGPPGNGQQMGVAARNENSVLFSLAALGGSVGSLAPAAPKSVDARPKTKEDSGLIDLNALMSAPLTPRSMSPAPASEAPVGAFTRELDSVAAPPPSRKRPIFVGLAAAAVLLAVVGLQVAARSADRAAAATVPPPVTAAVAAAAPKPAAEAAPTLASVAPSDAKPIVASTAAEPVHTRTHGKYAGHSGGRHASAHASAPVSHPAAAPDPCHCHGNLMCSMKCSAH